MPKTTKPAPQKAAAHEELNRWAIEMVIRWPRVSHGGYGLSQSQAYVPSRDEDADVIGRATKIVEWVKQAH
ncbi:hypothetical protein AOQ73_05785 [Bradyrhizobium pachyrhizi]|uniref:hypothetical protein n=1 Tax=Bradyrhizobium pachyrhizi TaxID=280333 RepID=UPI000704F3AE|nr:hypothetical protein [Bradyrhizobium pachyrhizi]KRQ11918.1 hypothetical protein AOQ73_05785 [Bradyrhizobium pachyrhizi]